MASTGLYLYEVRMERQQRVMMTCVKTGRPKTTDNQDFDISQVWCPSDEQCFGILSREPLGNIPSFELYDRLHISGTNALGIIAVSIVPVKEQFSNIEKTIYDHF